MKRALIQGIISILLFLSLWASLKSIDWIDVFQIDNISRHAELKLGQLYWDVLKQNEFEINNIQIEKTIDSILSAICVENKLNRSKYKIHIIKKRDINAFALPGGHIVIYSGLLSDTGNQQELAGVICHEMAHIELNHVMKTLVKEIGISVLTSMSTGKSDAEAVKKSIKLLSSSSLDRRFEKEADIKAVEYLVNSKINPDDFANFIFRLSKNQQKVVRYLSWISTHPDSIERAAYIKKHSKLNVSERKKIVLMETWDKFIENVNKY